MDRQVKHEMGIAMAASIKTELRAIHDNRNLEGNRTIFRIKQAWRRRWIRSFGDLYNYCDANMLGDSEELWDRVNAVAPRKKGDEFGQDEGNGEDEVFVQNVCDVANIAQDEVDRWIRAGGLYM